MTYKTMEMSILAKQICRHLLFSYISPDIYCTRTGATIIAERDIHEAVTKYGRHAAGPRYTAYGFTYVLMRPKTDGEKKSVAIFGSNDQRLFGIAFDDKEIRVPEDICQRLCL